jgi:HK97 family phage portal protein
VTFLDSAIQRLRKTGPNPAFSSRFPEWNWPTRSNQHVTESEALSLSTYYAGKTLIASTIASLPLHIYKDDESGTPIKQKTPDTYYLWGDPNPEQTRMQFFERVIGDEVTKAGFIWVEKEEGTGQPAALWHIERHRMQVGRSKSGQKVYLLDGEIGMLDYNQGGEIVHIPNWGTGIDGWDIVLGASQAIALGLSAEEFAMKSFEYGTTPPGIISSENGVTWDKDKALEIREEWTKLRRGTNALKVAVLSNAKYQQLNVNPETLQMEQIRKYQAGELATLLGVPPHMVGLVDKSSSWGAGIAQQTAGFATFTLARHIARVEHAINKFLLVRELTDRYCKFDLGGLLRGTLLERYQAYAIGYGRWLTVNDIRGDEDLPPVDGGDDVFAQLNVVPLDQLGNIGAMAPADAAAG